MRRAQPVNEDVATRATHGKHTPSRRREPGFLQVQVAFDRAQGRHPDAALVAQRQERLALQGDQVAADGQSGSPRRPRRRPRGLRRRVKSGGCAGGRGTGPAGRQSALRAARRLRRRRRCGPALPAPARSGPGVRRPRRTGSRGGAGAGRCSGRVMPCPTNVAMITAKPR